MKNTLKAILFAVALLTVICFTSNTAVAASPSEVELATWQEIKKGDYDKVFKMWYDNVDADTKAIMESQLAQMNMTVDYVMGVMKQRIQDEIEGNGGIKDVVVLEEKIAKNGKTATVKINVIFNNGKEAKQVKSYRKSGENWVPEMGYLQ